MTTVESAQLGKAKRVEDAAGRYIEFCKSTIPADLSLKGMKIVVDCAHGASYYAAPHVLDELGAEVWTLGCEPDGLNINADVGATAPQQLQRTVRERGATLGLALDGDGDRLIVVDHQGQVIDGDGILYIIARSRQVGSTLRGPVVGTVMSNLGLEHALQYHDIGFERTQVGDRYILERMKTVNGVLGGEPSGHIICRDRTTTGDGIISALQVLAEIVKSGRSINELLEDMQVYPQRLVNVRLPRQQDVLSLPSVQTAVRQAEQALNGRGRVLLRPSGTEPLIRVMVEGREAEEVDSLATGLADVVRGSLRP